MRNPPEWQICRLEGATLIPLGDLPAWIVDHPREATVAAIDTENNRLTIAIGGVKEELPVDQKGHNALRRRLRVGQRIFLRRMDTGVPSRILFEAEKHAFIARNNRLGAEISDTYHFYG